MKYIRLWGPVLLWMGIIFFFSSRLSVEVAPNDVINFLFFKTLHVLEYAVLYILFFRAVGRGVAAFCFTVLYALSDEIHQTFVPTREGRLRDVIIDAVGAGIAWITLYQLQRKMPKVLENLLVRLQIR